MWISWNTGVLEASSRTLALRTQTPQRLEKSRHTGKGSHMLKGLTPQTVGSWVPTTAEEEHEEHVLGLGTQRTEGWRESLQALPAVRWLRGKGTWEHHLRGE